MSESIQLTSRLAVTQRPALEQLLFFNVNQHRVRLGIQQSIETYGAPEIHEHAGELCIRVGDIEGVRNVFAVTEAGRPVGVAVYVRREDGRFMVLHLGVAPRSRASANVNPPVLLKLMHAIRGTARRDTGSLPVQLAYKHLQAQRERGLMLDPNR